MTPEFNANIAGSVLATDPPEHDALRAVLSDKLVPRALGETRASIRGYADRLVSEVVERGRFDGVVDVARTQLSLWCFRQIADLAPNHVISKDVPAELVGRAIRCQKVKIVPVERKDVGRGDRI